MKCFVPAGEVRDDGLSVVVGDRRRDDMAGTSLAEPHLEVVLGPVVVVDVRQLLGAPDRAVDERARCAHAIADCRKVRLHE